MEREGRCGERNKETKMAKIERERESDTKYESAPVLLVPGNSGKPLENLSLVKRKGRASGYCRKEWDGESEVQV